MFIYDNTHTNTYIFLDYREYYLTRTLRLVINIIRHHFVK